ncbi:hypothetical protein SKAU_G00272830 [Synaphobranchus kaupii]|uniref:Uncharacterized protein n=1 Tax=Synaphobranchus kaupii TaxID=118154 RepID=A0A9Q1F0X8_SYNKA|nr:hypothetical protein SKAU_G00272830 [Synaphobranchus kaupii]
MKGSKRGRSLAGACGTETQTALSTPSQPYMGYLGNNKRAKQPRCSIPAQQLCQTRLAASKADTLSLSISHSNNGAQRAGHETGRVNSWAPRTQHRPSVGLRRLRD